jgi:Ca2+-binding EF-hand superfamily protein
MLFSLLPRFINEKDKTDIVDTFQGLDESGFGLLSTNTLRKHLIECMIEQSKIDDIIKQADSDEDGFVTFGEFLCLTIDTKSIDFKESLVCLFKYLDNTGKGMIGQEQLLMAFKREANIFSPNEIKSLWKAYDKEEGSLVGIEEFIKMFI